jgi:hypothetical protein
MCSGAWESEAFFFASFAGIDRPATYYHLGVQTPHNLNVFVTAPVYIDEVLYGLWVAGFGGVLESLGNG